MSNQAYLPLDWTQTVRAKLGKRDREGVSGFTFKCVAINFIEKKPRWTQNNSAYDTLFCFNSASWKESVSLCERIYWKHKWRHTLAHETGKSYILQNTEHVTYYNWTGSRKSKFVTFNSVVSRFVHFYHCDDVIWNVNFLTSFSDWRSQNELW